MLQIKFAPGQTALENCSKQNSCYFQMMSAHHQWFDMLPNYIFEINMAWMIIPQIFIYTPSYRCSTVHVQNLCDICTSYDVTDSLKIKF